MEAQQRRWLEKMADEMLGRMRKAGSEREMREAERLYRQAREQLQMMGSTNSMSLSTPIEYDMYGKWPESFIMAKGNGGRSEEMRRMAEALREMSETLERIKKDALILYSIDRISKDEKYCFVKKGEQEIRIEAVKDLKRGDEVLLHPKSFQIVEHLGRPPLEVSRFAPDTVPNVKWSDIGGLVEAKKEMQEAVEIPYKYEELFKGYGRPGIKGILLAGPPGCGKTMLGKACANSIAQVHGKAGARTGFLYVKGPEILNKFVGNSEETVRDLFYDAARHKEEHKYPAVIFIDEADAILSARGLGGFSLSSTIVPAFLTEMALKKAEQS